MIAKNHLGLFKKIAAEPAVERVADFEFEGFVIVSIDFRSIVANIKLFPFHYLFLA